MQSQSLHPGWFELFLVFLSTPRRWKLKVPAPFLFPQSHFCKNRFALFLALRHAKIYHMNDSWHATGFLPWIYLFLAREALCINLLTLYNMLIMAPIFLISVQAQVRLLF